MLPFLEEMDPDESRQLQRGPDLFIGVGFTPGSIHEHVYGEDGSAYNNESHIADPDGDGPASAIDLGENDFKFVSLRGNAVLRWEYLPGSVVYFVWTQTRSESYSNPDFQFSGAFTNLTDLRPDNIFLIKMTYWLNM